MTETTALASQRWRRLMPLVFITYSFAYLDRSNYAIGSAGGLKHALQLTPGQVGLLGGLFFIGYFIFQVPAAIFAERRSVKRLMFWSLIAWGVFASLQGVVSSYPLLLVDRFLLGVVEAAVLPAMLVFLTHWFSSRERGRADTFLILGNPVTLLWMSVVSGYLIAATSYRWMFIIEGLPAIAWAFAFRALSADRPRDAKWLAPSERTEIEERLASEQAGVPKVEGYREAFKSWNVQVLSVQYALWSVGVYGFVFWLPTIVKSLSGHGIGSTGALSAIPYALAVVLMLGNSYVSDRVHQRRRLFVWPFLIVGAVAFYLSYRVGTGHFVESFVLLIIAGGVMYAPYGPYFAFIPEFLPQNVSGAAMGVINAFGALGGFAGAYVVGALGGGTKSGGAFIFMAACLLAAGLLMFLVKRPRVVEQEERPRGPRMRSAAAVLAARAGTSPDPLVGGSLESALHSGRRKTH
ncbi:MAG TPA: MFS transporter [Solirubrobacteraceae bacterium]